ncbi:DUF1538 domain-containing protein [Desulfonatronum lacustre]|uniref:DUF1538 domain-containing protein n=1 Tax=Desulfonatronum lacustre TaxID=66849 RepID=UPI00048E42F0|nr:DUF1538 domain-containing protein [Desulfonatronum lacustre]SMP50089.1 Protein of unknown function [Desulfonatronum zhilinae]
MKSDFKENLKEVVLAVLPISVVVILLQVFLVHLPWEVFARFLIGAAMVLAGLLLFLQGVKVGLLPMGEAVGSELPKHGSMIFMLVFAFILGFAVTVAEPDVRVLAHQVDIVSDGMVSSNVLIYTVAAGVAFFVALAMLRIVLRVPIAWLYGVSYLLIIVLSFIAPASFVPIAFDAGGVTTGPVTVPFILALGLGAVAVMGGRSSFSDGFGLVGLASIGPVIGVMILGMIYG